MMNLTVLISCMQQENFDIIKRSNVQTDVVVVNQCNIEKVDEFDFINSQGRVCHAKFISTKERGLSRSRNMCIRNATCADICLICDDDEILEDNYEQIILNAYNAYKDNIVITFSLNRLDTGRKYPSKAKIINFSDCLKTNSLQISFKKNLVEESKIQFDEMLGSGTGNGGGEENKFMLDCFRTKYKLNYIPEIIAKVLPGDSQYFKGYTKNWMVNQGWSMRRVLGPILGLIYIIYFILTHKKSYGEHMNMLTAFLCAMKGYFDKR